MEIRSAFTPAHSFDETITYLSKYSEEKIITALSGVPKTAKEYDLLVESTDREKFIELQEKIENGETYEIVGRPIYKNSKTFIPIKKGKR